MYQIEPRKKDVRGIFAIYPMVGCWDGHNLIGELGQVKARTKREAEAIACQKGLGALGSIWAVELVEDTTVVVTNFRGLP